MSRKLSTCTSSSCHSRLISTMIVLPACLTMPQWDAIISLVARDDCMFPYTYAEAVPGGECAEWDFFSLCGSPIGLVKVVMRLARLSAEKSKIASMLVSFDTSCIVEIGKMLQVWRHSP